MGVSDAGFTHEAVVEWNKNACGTIRENNKRGVISWPLFEADVRRFHNSPYGEGLDFLAGGPPCQPFSIGGKHRGLNDTRDMLPEADREAEPKVVIFENVNGLLPA